MKNKIIRTFTVTLAAVLCLTAFSTTAFAGGTDPNPEPLPETTEAPQEEEPTTGGMEPKGVPVTPEGNATLVDDFYGDKQLITVTTKAGNYFYILIDRANEDKETAVHFLNQVDDADLQALLEDGNGYLVSWCIGHLVSLADAGAYDERFKKWRYDDLPILPQEWQYIIPAEKKGPFAVLRSLMERPDVTGLVCATDAGREGELIFRFVYQMAGCKKPFKRLWISSMEDAAIREGFAHLKPGADYDDLYQSALCRAQADWLVGINATRLFSILYHKSVWLSASVPAAAKPSTRARKTITAETGPASLSCGRMTDFLRNGARRSPRRSPPRCSKTERQR